MRHAIQSSAIGIASAKLKAHHQQQQQQEQLKEQKRKEKKRKKKEKKEKRKQHKKEKSDKGKKECVKKKGKKQKKRKKQNKEEPQQLIPVENNINNLIKTDDTKTTNLASNMEEPSDDENFEPTPKKIKRDWLNSYCYSNKAMGMMKKMGYVDDKGLGKSNQGRLEPVIAVQQDGRRGFGLKLDTVHWSAGKWDPNCEDLQLHEPVLWLNQIGDNCGAYTLDQLLTHMVTGERKLTLDDETQYCDPEILHHILNAKTVFDDLNDTEKRRARSRCNPFETIRSSIFLNRAAVKMANIDAMCNKMFTEPRDAQGNSLLGNDELLYFADMCAGKSQSSIIIRICIGNCICV